MKRTISLLLILTLLPLFPITRAAEPETLEDIIAAQYDAYAASISQDKMDEKAIDQLLEPALYGKGETLHFDETDALTASLYGSGLFRKWFIEAASYAVRNMAELHLSRSMIGSGIQWHDFAYEYSIKEYYYDDTPSLQDDCAYRSLLKSTAQNVVSNRCDEAMILVVGGSSTRLRLYRTAVDFDSVTYRADVFWTDNFEFQSSYDKADKKGYNTTFSKLLTLLGPILGLQTFTWDSVSCFSITVPNLCTHSGGGSYYWESIEKELTSLPGEGQQDNPLIKHVRDSESDTSPKHYYTPEKPIELLSSNPWFVEFYISTGSSFTLSPVLKNTDTWLPQLYKSGTAVNGLITERYRGISPTSGKETTLTNRHYYGLDYVEQGIEKKGKKVFRIENRIADDGSNMLWLLIDGQEMGPINQHQIYHTSTKEYEPVGTDNSWINGSDITVRYIYNYSWPFTTTPLYWLKIDTAGDVLATREVSATCTQAAGIETTCLLCGAVWIDPTGEPLGHTPQVLPGTAATCTQEGLTDGSVCSICGEIIQPQVPVPMTAHTEAPLKGHVPTCTQEGLTDGTACSVCQTVLAEQKPIPALGHKEEIIPGLAASCISGGLSDSTVCSVCKTVLEEHAPIPALGHAYEQGLCVRCGGKDPNGLLPGDADENGTVNYNDALLTLRCAIGLETLSPAAAVACDVDGDGSLSYNDALVILRRSIGLE